MPASSRFAAAVLAILLIPAGSRAVTFTDIGAGFTGVQRSAAAWGDYDNDGDLDLVLTGASGATRIARVYRNTGGVFADIAAGLTGVSDGACAWGDCDNDGDLDLVITGTTASGAITRVYRNDAGTFVDAGAGLPGVSSGSVAWADADGDGILDLLLTGDTGSGFLSAVYRNDGSAFHDLGAALPGVSASAVAWADADGDGDMDFVLTGDTGSGFISRVYRNDGVVFHDVGAALTAVAAGAVAWGDYDADGDADLVIAGETSPGLAASIYRNDGGGTFTDIGAGFPGVSSGCAAWADYDDDGDLDLALTGYKSPGTIARIYRQDALGVFVDAAAGLPGDDLGTVAWGDYDRDGDLDLLFTGQTVSGPVARIYRSSGAPLNAPPSTPSHLAAVVTASQVTLSWNASLDAETPLPALSYNLRVGTTPGGSDVMSAMSDGASGFRRVVAGGNAGARTSWTIHRSWIPGTDYYWSVQAVDGEFAGSAFAAEGRFGIVGFTPGAAAFSGVDSCAAAWGDMDGDGDLDLALLGNTGATRSAAVYRNDGGGVFTDIGAGLPGVQKGALAWGDVDGDGDLDLYLAGSTATGRISRIYRNQSGTFADIGAGLPGVTQGAAAWGDYDNDGDLDLLVTGFTGSAMLASIYRNDGGVFRDIGAGLDGVNRSAAAWADVDNDGDLDIIVAGDTGEGYVTELWRNTGGLFTEVAAGLPGVQQGALAWGDFDADGDLDLALAGNTGSALLARLYRNDAGALTDVAAGLPGVAQGALAWGDYDNDGALDLALAGDTGAGLIARIYRNGGGSLFTDVAAGFPGVGACAVAWGDDDNDGDLDLLVAGNTGSGRIARLYQSVGAPPDAAPAAPSNLTATFSASAITLSWTAAGDPETRSAGLTYNLRVGSSPGASDVVAPMSDPASGFRRVVALGNAMQRTSWTFPRPARGTPAWYWSVQAVDGAAKGSPFAPESFFALTDVAPWLGATAGSSRSPAIDAEPNPWDSLVRLHFALPRAAPATIAIYAVGGRRVRTVAVTGSGAGAHEIVWDGRDDDGSPVPAGVYFARIRADGASSTCRMVRVN